MTKQIYIRPEFDIVVLSEESGLCVNGSGSNEDYNINKFKWDLI